LRITEIKKGGEEIGGGTGSPFHCNHKGNAKKTVQKKLAKGP